jgi:hypothetical protein
MLIDRLAKAVHAADGLEAFTDYERLPEKQREGYVFVVRAVLAQLEVEGLKIVPKTPTANMANAAGFALRLGVMEFSSGYSAMIAAAPRLEELP